MMIAILAIPAIIVFVAVRLFGRKDSKIEKFKLSGD
jgi:hypothetical protein